MSPYARRIASRHNASQFGPMEFLVWFGSVRLCSQSPPRGSFVRQVLCQPLRIRYPGSAKVDIDSQGCTMKNRAKIAIVAAVLVSCCFPPHNTSASHSTFKKALQRRYELGSVSCNTCHVAERPRTERNALGKVFYDRMKDKHLSRQFRDARKKGFEARREVESRMTREFIAVLKRIEPLPTENGRTFRQRFRAAEFPGLRLR